MATARLRPRAMRFPGGIVLSSSQSARTRMFARVLGPYLIIAEITAVARAAQMRMLLSEFRTSAAWPWVTGTLVLLLGLVVIALHPYWGSAAAIVVSLLGWSTALKGLFLLAFPDTYLWFATQVVDTAAGWRVGCVVMALAGLYLTLFGWVPARNRPTPHAAGTTQDLLPRAA